MKTNKLFRLLVIAGGTVSVGFGIWHFFVPATYGWWAAIVDETGELVRAVRAINIFFSLSLAIFGLQSILFTLHEWANLFVMRVQLAAMTALWTARVALQIAYPQGALIGIAPIMLGSFVIVLLCFLVPLVLVRAE
jgi:hypothetical protein